MHDNKIENTTIGITGWHVNSTAADNVIVGNSALYPGSGISGQWQSSTISGNAISDYTFGSGMSFVSYSDRPDSSGVTITGNTLANNLVGIVLGQDGASLLAGFANNQITASSTQFSLAHGGTDTLDLTLTAHPGFTGNTVNGIDLHSPTLADQFALEDTILHRIDGTVPSALVSSLFSNVGLVLLMPNTLYVTPNSYSSVFLNTNTPSIQRAVDAASSGFTINVEAGSYPDNVDVDKPLTIVGAGSASTTVSATSGKIVTIGADSVTLQGLTLSGSASTTGVYINSAVSDASLTDIVSTGNHYGLQLDSSAVVSNLSLTETSLVNGTVGLEVESAAKLDGMTVTSSHFDDNTLGWNVKAASGAVPTDFTDITVTGTALNPTTFDENAGKGIYAERLNDATLEYISLTHSGYDTGYPSTPTGINLNLKYANYSGITIQHATLLNNGLGSTAPPLPGGGITIAATSGYSATLSTLNLTDVDVDGSPLDLWLDGDITGVAMSGVTLEGAGAGFVYTGTAAALDLGDTSFATDSGYIVNYSMFGIDATGASFTKTAGVTTFTSFNPGTADPSSAADLAKYYAVEDFVLDADRRGLARRAG